MVFTISRFRAKTSNSPEVSEQDLEGLCELLTTFYPCENKDDAPLWSPAVYAPGSARKDENVIAISCLALDFDSGIGWEDFVQEWHKLTFIIHTTHSHSREHPKWRAVFPLAHPVPAADWKSAFERLSKALSFGNADPACKNLSRIYFLPSHAADAPRYRTRHEGELLNPDEPTKEEPVHESETKVGDAYDKEATWDEIFEPCGWHKVEGRKYCGVFDLWSRPGKEAKLGEHSARTGVGTAGDRCIIWTSTGVDARFVKVPLKKWHLYAVLRFGGDFKSAIKELAGIGYGNKSKRKSAVAAAPPDDEPEPDKRIVIVNNRDHIELATECLNLLHETNEPPHIFLRSDILARIEKGERGPIIKNLSLAALRGELCDAATYVRKNADGQKKCPPPVDAMETMMAFPIHKLGFPVLKGIASCPTLAKRTIVYQPGYIEATKYFGWFKEEFEPSPLPAKECAEILLNDFLGDFPFADDASKAHALALMLLPILRPAIKGSTPLHIIDAPAPGTGKTLLARVCLAVGLEDDPSPTAMPDDENELSKKLFAALLAGARSFFLDNLTRTLVSPTLAGALTSDYIEGRILGMSSVAAPAVNAIFIATSNNVQLSRDIARRSLWIRLDAKMEDPEKREGFKRDHILNYALTNRVYLLGLLCKLVEEWLSELSPSGSKRKGTYERWAAIIGGILEVAGVTGFLDNEDKLKELAVEDDGEWKAFVAAWAEEFGSAPVTSKELAELAKTGNYLENLLSRAKDEKSSVMVVGRAVKKRIDRVFESFQITKSTMQRGENRFKLETSGGHGGLSILRARKSENGPDDLFSENDDSPKKIRIDAESPPSPPFGANQVQNSGGLCEPGEIDDNPRIDSEEEPYDPFTDE